MFYDLIDRLSLYILEVRVFSMKRDHSLTIMLVFIFLTFFGVLFVYTLTSKDYPITYDNIENEFGDLNANAEDNEIDYIKHETNFQDIDKDLFCMSNVYFQINNACIKDNELKIVLTNGNYSLNSLLVKFTGAKENLLYINESLNMFQAKEFSADINGVGLNSLNNKVEVFPLISIRDNIFLCNFSRSYENVGFCERACEDGTLYTRCSKNRPYFCENGELVRKCSICGCDQGLFCNNELCGACQEGWICGGWGDCLNSVQKRGCFEANNCGTSINKPAEERAC